MKNKINKYQFSVQPRWQLEDQLIEDQLWYQLWGQLGDQLWEQLRNQLWDQLRNQQEFRK